MLGHAEQYASEHDIIFASKFKRIRPLVRFFCSTIERYVATYIISIHVGSSALGRFRSSCNSVNLSLRQHAMLIRPAGLSQEQTYLNRVSNSISAGVTHATCMKIIITGDSVAMGDDINAAHERKSRSGTRHPSRRLTLRVLPSLLRQSHFFWQLQLEI